MPRTLSTAALAVSAFLLVGCNGGDDPTPSNSSTTSTTSTTSSTTSSPTSTTPTADAPVKPEFPAEAEENTQAGAEAFVRYFWDAVNYAWTAPDDEVLKNLGSAKCVACRAFEEEAETFVAERHRYSSPPLRVELVRWGLESDGRVIVGTNVTQLKSTVVDSEGEVVAELPEETASRPFSIRWDDGWSIEEIG